MITQTLYFIALIFVLSIFIWKLIQDYWDAQIFGHHSQHRFAMNLSTVQALGIFRHTPGMVAVDVRPVTEFKRQHLPNALNAPFQNGKLDSSSIDELDRHTPILLYCQGGYRSRKALTAIEALGFQSIYHLNRGFKMWRLFSGPFEGPKIKNGQKEEGS